jgi:hypothetical protein
MLKLLVPMSLMLLVISATPAAQRSQTVQGEQSDGHNNFVGTWKLLSTSERFKDGSVRPWKFIGPHGVGYLMYAADGHMCAELMNPNRPKWDRPPTTEQKISAIDGFGGYCGTYRIDEASHVMFHYPEVASKPAYLNSEQRRPYRMENGRLTFSYAAGPEDESDVERWTMTWEKMK